jgi:predicted MPP superfamily phosphohydrolase
MTGITKKKNCMKLIEQISYIAPVYYVTGNHEYFSGQFLLLEQRLKGLEVRVLRNESVKIKREWKLCVNAME